MNCKDKTVNYEENLKRLKSLGESDSIIFNFGKQFKKLQNMRNRIEHYIVDFKNNDFLIIFHEVMPFINNYFEKELLEDITSLFKNWNDFLEIDSFSKSRIETMKKFIEDNEPSNRDIKHGTEFHTIECTQCCKGLMILQNDNFYCKYCGNEESYNICSRCGEYILENDWNWYNEELDICIICFDELCNRK